MPEFQARSPPSPGGESEKFVEFAALCGVGVSGYIARLPMVADARPSGNAPMSVTRVAVVTGGGSGIGAAACRELARRGNRVAVLDINGYAARQVADDLKTLGSDGGGTRSRRHRP